ncbi:MAG: peptidoglycan DD-metalloendopeptidase family protein [Candidatus Stygibacter australis]|nr:peptidoglycan DD-metalloendopeptidase family protein [Candidatus Stygibacter australis]MDP8322136.1 peptidoglycan DD-metalloendopeptidase family protein [Candidatus Stygibacter australis]
MFRILIVIILLSAIYINADELSDKQQELEKLNSELEQMDTLIEQNQNQKAAKEAQKAEMRAKKQKLESTICELETNQCKAQEEWDKTRQRLKNTNEDLNSKKQTVQELYNSAYELSSALVISHYASILYPSADSWILATSLEAAGEELQTVNADINSLESSRKSLETKEKKDEKYFKDVQWNKIVSKKKKSRYQKELIIIDKEVTSLDQEYQEAMKRKRELEEAQAAMNDLIARLQNKTSYKPDYSYKFTYERLIWPVEGKIIRGYGDYQAEGKRLTLHNDGIDISVDIGTEVKCVDKGVVVFAGRNGGSGRVVIVDHQNGYYSIYSHNDHLLVTLGDTVEKGTILAESGQSGLVDEPCLHFEIRRDARAANPLEYLEF